MAPFMWDVDGCNAAMPQWLDTTGLPETIFSETEVWVRQLRHFWGPFPRTFRLHATSHKGAVRGSACADQKLICASLCCVLVHACITCGGMSRGARPNSRLQDIGHHGARLRVTDVTGNGVDMDANGNAIPISYECNITGMSTAHVRPS